MVLLIKNSVVLNIQTFDITQYKNISIFFLFIKIWFESKYGFHKNIKQCNCFNTDNEKWLLSRKSAY